MASRSLDDLHPLLKPKAESFFVRCKETGFDAFPTCTYRSNTEQDDNYAQGRTKPGKIITNARAGQSKHNYTMNGKPAAMAFDFAIKGKDGLNWDTSSHEWTQAIRIGKELGLTSGADFKTLKDYAHMELKL